MRFKLKLALNLLMVVVYHPSFAVAQSPLKLAYDKPAGQWTEALPLGNGRIGAMVFGGTEDERLQINESTLWGGGPHDYAAPDSNAHLDEIRSLILAGKVADVEKLAASSMMGQPRMLMSETQGSFLTTVLSMTEFPEAARPDDHRDVGCAFSFGEQLRRITRRKEVSTCRPYRILQTLTANLGWAGSLHLHFSMACTGRRLKYCRGASECSCTKRGSPKVGVLGISGNLCTVTEQQIWKSWHSLQSWHSQNQ